MSDYSSVLDKYPLYEVVIGIEVHVQLKTKSKMFCGCQVSFGAPSNTNICKVCSGMLGSLPVLNLQAVNFAIAAGLATNCSIARVSEFARKHYVYPDLPKNYQITQDDKPICLDGFLDINVGANNIKKIRLNRIHIEEDAGKTIHGDGYESYVDLNRAGTPLIEIVSEPDISSSHEAVSYLEQLKTIIEYIGVSTANMEEGSFRADVNVSIKKRDSSELGTRAELKNINSFKFIFDAIEFEIERQVKILESGGSVSQETRLWDSDKKSTFCMRSKENAHGYRYFPDPDLPPILIDDEWVNRIRGSLPELPSKKFSRFKADYFLTDYEASILSLDKNLSDYFEKVVVVSKSPKKSVNWVLRDILGLVKESKVEVSELVISPEMLGELLLEIEKGVISSKIAKDVFDEMIVSGKYPSIIIQEKGLEKLTSRVDLERLVNESLALHEKQLQDFINGNLRMLPFLVGQVMKASFGKADPVVVTEILNEKIK